MIDDKVKKKIGQRINEALASRNMMQKDLAQKMGMSKGSETVISHCCKGNRVPNTEQVLLMAKVLDVPVGFLLGDNIPPTNEHDVANACSFTGLTMESALFLHDLNEEAKQENGWRERNILRVINMLLDEARDSLSFWDRLQAFMFTDGGKFTLHLKTGSYDVPRDDILASLLSMNNAYLLKLKSEKEE